MPYTYVRSSLTTPTKITATGDISVQASSITTTHTGTGSAIKCASFSCAQTPDDYNSVTINGAITNGYAIEATTGGISLGGSSSFVSTNAFKCNATITGSGVLLAATGITLQSMQSSNFILPTLGSSYSVLNWSGTPTSTFMYLSSVPVSYLAGKDINVGYYTVSSVGALSVKSLTSNSTSASSVIATGGLTVTNSVNTAGNLSYTLTGNSSIGGNVVGTGSAQITLGATSGYSLTVTGYISASGALVFDQSGTLNASNISTTSSITLNGPTVNATTGVVANGAISFTSGVSNQKIIVSSGNISGSYLSAGNVGSGCVIQASGSISFTNVDTASSYSGTSGNVLQCGGNFSTGGALTLGGSAATFTIGGNFTIGVSGSKSFTQNAGTLDVTGTQSYTNYYIYGSAQNTLKHDINVGEFTYSGGTLILNTNVDLVFSNLTVTSSSAKYITINSGATITCTGTLLTLGAPWYKTGAGANTIVWTSTGNKTLTGIGSLTADGTHVTHPKVLVNTTSGNITMNGALKDFETIDSYAGSISHNASVIFGGNVKLGANTTYTGNVSVPISFQNWNAIVDATYNPVASDVTITSSGKTWNASAVYFNAYNSTTSAVAAHVKLADAFTTSGSVTFGLNGGTQFDFNGYTLTTTQFALNAGSSGWYRRIKNSGALASLVCTSNAVTTSLTGPNTGVYDYVDFSKVQIDTTWTTPNSTGYTNTVTVNSYEIKDPYDGVPTSYPDGITSPGTYLWTVPSGVTEISAVAVGGGGGGAGSNYSSWSSGGGGGGGALHYRTFSVTPGETLTIVVGAAGVGGSPGGANNATAGGDSFIRRGAIDLVRAGGGGRGTGNSAGTAGQSYFSTLGGGGGNGGSGGVGSSNGGGGGGAGGYSGNGGTGMNGGTNSGSTAGSGGGGGGGGSDSSATGSFRGGGVAIYGLGNNGSAGVANGNGGDGSTNQGSATVYGGGGCGGDNVSTTNYSGANGLGGAVRIVWTTAQKTRAFPSTNVSVSATPAATTPTKVGLTIRGSGTNYTLAFSRTVDSSNMRFGSLISYMTRPITVSFHTRTFEIDDWQLNGSSLKSGVPVGNHVGVIGNGSASTTLLKTGSGQNVFKYCGVKDLTLSGNWTTREAAAINHDTVALVGGAASPNNILGRYQILTSGTSISLPSSWNNSNNLVNLYGGGGGGGTSYYLSSSVVRAGGGGGGGGFSQIKNFVAPPSTVSYSIGSGGTTGVAGGNTTWHSGAYVAGGGGAGGSSTGAGGVGGTGTGYNGGVGYNGGTGGTSLASGAWTVAYRGAGGGGAGGLFGPGVSVPAVTTSGTANTSYGGAASGGTAAADGVQSSNAFGYINSAGSSNTFGIDAFGFTGAGAGGNGAIIATSGANNAPGAFTWGGGGGGGGYKPAATTATYSGGLGAPGAIMLVWNVPLDIINTQFFLTI